MSKELDRIYLLAEKVKNNTISDSELDEFNAWYNSFDDQSVDLGENTKEVRERILDSLMQRLSAKRKSLFFKLPTIGIAASLLIFFTWFFFRDFHNIPSAEDNKVVVLEHDVKPGADRAILTLANGKELNLDNVKPGLITTQGNFQVFKSKNNVLTYKMVSRTNKKIAVALLNNLLTVPKGGKYEAVLPDGSHIWLNANSSLSFPLSFGTGERRVGMSGEGYFEVAKDRKKVFRVATHNQIIEVLGTHFNVKSYLDEPVCKITLLEGAVRVVSGASKHSTLLKPGQQAEIINRTNRIATHNVDAIRSMAWKSGYFEFSHTDLKSLMSQLSRWYNVDIVYQGAISDEYYEGRISRNVNLSEVLKILENGGVNFKIEGNKLIVAADNN